MSLSKEDKEQLVGLLSAAITKPSPPLAERLGTVEILRKWFVVIVSVIVIITGGIWQVRTNSKFVHEWGPKVKVMWWMKQNGLTNKDVEPTGPMKIPDFD